ncbi:hypothetical protein PTTG_07012 [Puccinia triticina 1-1 BBBD Race 1]|uniref:Uncharacterized protein n=1 Tax=Puccinia triticina (isolate 1-1 / race 1 (BBBD)) TaxID=630390 RepID=A0A180G987_PUCT1|nr:hypothetical protein PTTG_07012 [Puccinia triticina 1-1 BBBD Race 1]
MTAPLVTPRNPANTDHPSNPHLIYTSSYDGTIRELNLESQQSMEVVDCQALSAKDNIFLSAFEFSNQDRKIWASNTTGGLVHCNRPPDIGLLPPLSFPAIDGFDFSLDLPCRAGPAGPAANNLPALPSSPPLPSSLSNIIHPLLALLAPLTSTPAPWPRSSLLPPSLRPVPPPRAIQPTPALLPRVSRPVSPTLLNAVCVALSAAVHAAPPHPWSRTHQSPGL